jgi:hypothetical protein
MRLRDVLLESKLFQLDAKSLVALTFQERILLVRDVGAAQVESWKTFIPAIDSLEAPTSGQEFKKSSLSRAKEVLDSLAAMQRQVESVKREEDYIDSYFNESAAALLEIYREQIAAFNLLLEVNGIRLSSPEKKLDPINVYRELYGDEWESKYDSDVQSACSALATDSVGMRQKIRTMYPS